MSVLCDFLQWDSDFFGMRIGRISTTRINESVFPDIDRWVHEHSVDCLYFQADSSNDDSIRTAELYGFNLVDIRVMLHFEVISEAKHADFSRRENIRFSKEGDIPALRAIAGKSHHATRYYHDHNFPRDKCDLLYQEWIEKSCMGLADVVLVCEVDGRLAGYLTARHVRESAASIGLTAVDVDIRGRGIGGSLLEIGRAHV